MKKFIFFAGLVRGLGPENFSPKVYVFSCAKLACVSLKWNFLGMKMSTILKGKKYIF